VRRVRLPPQPGGAERDGGREEVRSHVDEPAQLRREPRDRARHRRRGVSRLVGVERLVPSLLDSFFSEDEHEEGVGDGPQKIKGVGPEQQLREGGFVPTRG